MNRLILFCVLNTALLAFESFADAQLCACADASCGDDYRNYRPSPLFSSLDEIQRDLISQSDRVRGLNTHDSKESLAQHWKCHRPFVTPMFRLDAAGELVAQTSSLPSTGTVHVGVSGWYNYDFIVARQSEYAILADLSVCVVRLHEVTGDIIVVSRNRFDFVDRMNRAFDQYPCIRGPDPIENLLHHPGSWLSSDEKFAFIQKMFSEGRLYPIQIDLLNHDAMMTIAHWLKDNQLVVDMLYLANISYIWDEALNVVARRYAYKQQVCGLKMLCDLNDWVFGEKWLDESWERQHNFLTQKTKGQIVQRAQDMPNELATWLNNAPNKGNISLSDDFMRMSQPLMAITTIISDGTWIIDQYEFPWRIFAGRQSSSAKRFHPSPRIRGW